MVLPLKPIWPCLSDVELESDTRSLWDPRPGYNTGGIQINRAMIAMNTFITVSQPSPLSLSSPAQYLMFWQSDSHDVSGQFGIFIINILGHPRGWAGPSEADYHAIAGHLSRNYPLHLGCQSKLTRSWSLHITDLSVCLPLLDIN